MIKQEELSQGRCEARYANSMPSLFGYDSSNYSSYYCVLIGVSQSVSNDCMSSYDNVSCTSNTYCQCPGHSVPLISGRHATGLFR